MPNHWGREYSEFILGDGPQPWACLELFGKGLKQIQLLISAEYAGDFSTLFAIFVCS
jgi:hypothetical protein